MANALEAYSQDGQFRQYDVFISHRYKEDKNDIEKLKYKIEEYGYSVYVDWIEDPQMDRSKATAENAELIRTRMRMSTCLIFAYSSRATPSVWVPWELGFFDGEAGSRIGVLPLDAGAEEKFKDQQYLDLYETLSMETLEQFLHRNASPVRQMDNIRAFHDWMAKMMILSLQNPMNLYAGLMHWTVGEMKQWSDIWAKNLGVPMSMGGKVEEFKGLVEDLRLETGKVQMPPLALLAKAMAPIIWANLNMMLTEGRRMKP